MGGFPVSAYLERLLALCCHHVIFVYGFYESFQNKTWILSSLYCLHDIERLHNAKIGKSLTSLLSLHDLSEALLLCF